MAPPIPLFLKLILAQLLAVGAAFATVLLLTDRLGWPTLPLVPAAVATFAVVFLTVGAVLDAILLRLALTPLTRLEAVARDVVGGDQAARVGSSPQGERRVATAIRAFDEMLDALRASKDRERDMVARVLATEGHERDRLARALFEGPSQSLAETLVRLQLARRHSDLMAPTADDLRTSVASALEEVSRIARRLQPPELADLGVIRALEARVRHLTADRAIGVSFQGRVPEARLTPELRVAFFRIADQALSNAVAHAGASNIRIRFSPREKGLELRVMDDGRGFDVRSAMAAETGNLGLLEMRWRAACVSGRLHVVSRAHEGTVVTAFLPWMDTAPWDTAGTDPAADDVTAPMSPPDP